MSCHVVVLCISLCMFLCKVRLMQDVFISNWISHPGPQGCKLGVLKCLFSGCDIILAEGAIALSVTLSGGALFAS